MATLLVSNFVNILNRQFENEEVFFQLEDALNSLEKTDDPDDIGYELEDLIDMLTNENMWSAEADLGIDVSEVMESANMDGWTSGTIPANPKVYTIIHDDDIISDGVYALVVTEGSSSDIHAICFNVD
jgi:hypothetical protein